MSTLTSLVGGRRWAARSVIVLAVLALIVTALAVVPALGDHDGGHPHISDFPNEGVLSLHLGDDGDYFEYREWNNTLPNQYDPADEPADQLIELGRRCKVDSISDDDEGDLATIASRDEHNVGLHDSTNNLGIQDSNSRNIHCGQVDVTEGKLSIALADGSVPLPGGGATSPGPLVDKVIDYAEIDFDVKQGVVIMGEFFLDDVPIGTHEILDCASTPDCGPDSVGGDNVRAIIAAALPDDYVVPDDVDVVEVPSVWDRLDLYVVDPPDDQPGAFSLGGGFEAVEDERGPLGLFLGTNDTLFHITDMHACGGEPIEFEGEGFVGTYELLGCTGAKGIVIEADVDSNEITITHSGPVLEGAFSIEEWTFLPAPTNARLEYDDGFRDGGWVPPVLIPPYPGGSWLLAPFCLDDPEEDLPDIDPLTFLPPIAAEATTYDDETGNDPVHTTCIITETKTTMGQFDLGSGLETAIRYKVKLLSIADSGRSFR